MEAFLRTLQAQATALTTFAAHGGVHGDEPDLLGGAPSDAFSLRSMGGARGAAAMEMHRRELRDNPGRVAGKIRSGSRNALGAILRGLTRSHGPHGVLARTWPTASVMVWVAVLLSGYLLLYFARI